MDFGLTPTGIKLELNVVLLNNFNENTMYIHVSKHKTEFIPSKTKYNGSTYVDK